MSGSSVSGSAYSFVSAGLFPVALAAFSSSAGEMAAFVPTFYVFLTAS